MYLHLTNFISWVYKSAALKEIRSHWFFSLTSSRDSSFFLRKFTITWVMVLFNCDNKINESFYNYMGWKPLTKITSGIIPFLFETLCWYTWLQPSRALYEGDPKQIVGIYNMSFDNILTNSSIKCLLIIDTVYDLLCPPNSGCFCNTSNII